MNNLKPIMKETIAVPNPKPGLLKKKPFGKTDAAPTKGGGLMARLTGKC